MQILFQYELVTIEYQSAHDLLCLNWVGYITAEDYINIMREMVRLTKELNIIAWFIDASKADEINMGDTSWAINYLTNFIQFSNLRKIARLVSADSPFHGQTEKIVNSNSFKNLTRLEFQIFTNKAEAKTWLIINELNRSEAAELQPA